MNPYVLLIVEPVPDPGSTTDMKDFGEKQDFIYLSSV
jgi:hypothetical protein